MNKILKPNDIFLATSELRQQVLEVTAGNEDAMNSAYGTILLSLGLNKDNTQLLSYEEYKELPYVKRKYSTESGVFREDLYKADYILALKNYNIITDVEAIDNFMKFLDKQTPYPYTSPQAVKGKDVIISLPTVRMAERMALGNPTTIGLSGIGHIDQTDYTFEELAQMNPHFYNPETDSWTNHSVELESIFDRGIKKTFNYAKYENDEETINPITGETVRHLKGEWKLDENGLPYCEVLGSRSPANKLIVLVYDILTSEGTFANSINAFETDDAEKSPAGVITKNVLRVLPYVIPYFNEYYGGATAFVNFAFSLGALSLSLYSSASGKEAEGLNSWINFGKKYEFLSSSETQQNGLSTHMGRFESALDMMADAAGQLYQQRAASSIPFLFKRLRSIAKAFKAEKAWLDSHPLDISMVNGRYKALTDTGKARLSSFNESAKKVSEFNAYAAHPGVLKAQTALNLGYMALMEGQNMYLDALEHGMSKREAGIVSLSSMLSIYGMMRINTSSFGLGKRFLTMTTKTPTISATGDYINTAMYKKLGLQLALEEKAIGGLANNQEQALSRMAKWQRAMINSGVIFQDMGKDALVEGVEEVTEEISQDFVRALADTTNWLSGLKGSFGGFNNFTDDDLRKQLIERYVTTFVGGALGGAVFTAQRHLNTAWKNKIAARRGEPLDELDLDIWKALESGQGKLLKEALHDKHLLAALDLKELPVTENVGGEDITITGAGTSTSTIGQNVLANVEARIDRLQTLFDSVYPVDTNDSKEKQGIANLVKSNFINDYKARELEEKYFKALLRDRIVAVASAKEKLNLVRSNTSSTEQDIKNAENEYKTSVKNYNDFWSPANIALLNQLVKLAFTPELLLPVKLLNKRSFVYHASMEDGTGLDYNALNSLPLEEYEKLPMSLRRNYKNYWDEQWQLAAVGLTEDNLKDVLPLASHILNSIIGDAAESFTLGKRNFLAAKYLNTYLLKRASAIVEENLGLRDAATGFSLLGSLLAGENQNLGKVNPLTISENPYLSMVRNNPSAFSALFLLTYDFLQDYLDKGLLSIDSFKDLEEFSPGVEYLVHELFNHELARSGKATFDAKDITAVINRINLLLTDPNNLENDIVRHIKMIIAAKQLKDLGKSLEEIDNLIHSEAGLQNLNISEYLKSKSIEIKNSKDFDSIVGAVEQNRIVALINEFKEESKELEALSLFDGGISAVVLKFADNIEKFADDTTNIALILDLTLSEELRYSFSEELKLQYVSYISSELKVLAQEIREINDSEIFGKEKLKLAKDHIKQFALNSESLPLNTSVEVKIVVSANLSLEFLKELLNIFSGITPDAAQVNTNISVDLDFYNYILATLYLSRIDQLFKDKLELIRTDDNAEEVDTLLQDLDENGWDSTLTKLSNLLLGSYSEEVETIIADIVNKDLGTDMSIDELKDLDFTLVESTYDFIRDLADKIQEKSSDPVENLLKTIYRAESGSENGFGAIEYINKIIKKILLTSGDNTFILGESESNEFIEDGLKSSGILQDIYNACLVAEAVLLAARRVLQDPNSATFSLDLSSYTDFTRANIKHLFADGKVEKKEERDALLKKTISISSAEYDAYKEQLDAIKSQLQLFIGLSTQAQNDIDHEDNNNLRIHIQKLYLTYASLLSESDQSPFGRLLKTLFSSDDKGIIYPEWIRNAESDTQAQYNFINWVELTIANALQGGSLNIEEFKQAVFDAYSKKGDERIYLSTPVEGEKATTAKPLNNSFLHYRLLSLCGLSPAQFLKFYSSIVSEPESQEKKPKLIKRRIDQEIAVREIVSFFANIDSYINQLVKEPITKDSPKIKLSNTYICRGSSGSGKSSVVGYAAARWSILNGKKVHLIGKSPSIQSGMDANIYDYFTTEEQNRISKALDPQSLFIKLLGNETAEALNTKIEEINAFIKNTLSSQTSAEKSFDITTATSNFKIVIKVNGEQETIVGISDIQIDGNVGINPEELGTIIVDEATYLDEVTVALLNAICSKSNNNKSEELLVLLGDRRLLGAITSYELEGKTIELKEDFSNYFTVPAIELNNAYRAQNTLKKHNMATIRPHAGAYYPGNIIANNQGGEAAKNFAAHMLISPLEWGVANTDDGSILLGDYIIRHSNNVAESKRIIKILAESITKGDNLAVVIPATLNEQNVWVVNDNKKEEVKNILKEFLPDEIVNDTEKVLFTCATDIQGKEFDNVILWDLATVNKDDYDNWDVDYSIMYTLLTRSRKFTLISCNGGLDSRSLFEGGTKNIGGMKASRQYLALNSKQLLNPPIPGKPNADVLKSAANSYAQMLSELAGALAEQTIENPVEEEKVQEVKEGDDISEIYADSNDSPDVTLNEDSETTDEEDKAPAAVLLVMLDGNGLEVQVPLVHAFYLRYGTTLPQNGDEKYSIKEWAEKLGDENVTSDFLPWLQALAKGADKDNKKSIKELKLEFLRFRNRLLLGENVCINDGNGNAKIVKKQFDSTTDKTQLLFYNDPSKEQPDGSTIMLYLIRAKLNGSEFYVTLGRLGANAKGDRNSDYFNEAQLEIFESSVSTFDYTFKIESLQNAFKPKYESENGVLSRFNKIWKNVKGLFKNGLVPISGSRTTRGYMDEFHPMGRYTIAELKDFGFTVLPITLSNLALKEAINKARGVELDQVSWLNNKLIVKVMLPGLEDKDEFAFYTKVVLTVDTFSDALQTTSKKGVYKLPSIRMIIKGLEYLFAEKQPDQIGSLLPVSVGVLAQGISQKTLEERKEFILSWNDDVQKLKDSILTGISNSDIDDKIKVNLKNLTEEAFKSFLTANGWYIINDNTIEESNKVTFINLVNNNQLVVVPRLFKSALNYLNENLKGFAFKDIESSNRINDNYQVEYAPQLPRFIIPLLTDKQKEGGKASYSLEKAVTKASSLKIVVDASRGWHQFDLSILDSLEGLDARGKDIVLYDTETTGLNALDRILQIAAVKYHYDPKKKSWIESKKLVIYANPFGSREALNTFFNNNSFWNTSDKAELRSRILDATLMDLNKLNDFLEFISNTYVVGYNNSTFDNEMLIRELQVTNTPLDKLTSVQSIDVMSILHSNLSEPLHKLLWFSGRGKNTNSAIYKELTGEDLKNAHDAIFDIVATFRIFKLLIQEIRDYTHLSTLNADIISSHFITLPVNPSTETPTLTVDEALEKLESDYTESEFDSMINMANQILDQQDFSDKNEAFIIQLKNKLDILLGLGKEPTSAEDLFIKKINEICK